MFECRHLSVRYKSSDANAPAVNDVSFEIKSGEMVSVVGESGSGKSSVAYAIGRLLGSNTQVDGEIWLSGSDLLTLHEKQLNRIRKELLAFIFQDPTTSLNPLMTIRKQLSMAMPSTIQRGESLKQVGLDDVERILSAYPHELSGGMKQRVMIAIAMSKKPKLIIADEPTASLDATIGIEVMKKFKSLCHQNQCAVLLITHDLKMAQMFSERTLFMKSGRLVDMLSKGHPLDGRGYAHQLMCASILNQKPKSRINLVNE